VFAAFDLTEIKLKELTISLTRYLLYRFYACPSLLFDRANSDFFCLLDNDNQQFDINDLVLVAYYGCCLASTRKVRVTNYDQETLKMYSMIFYRLLLGNEENPLL
jgi:hypothetical protein